MSLLAPTPHRTDRRRPERGVTRLGEAAYRPPMASPPGEQTMTALTATPDTAPRPPVTAGDAAELLEPLRREILAHCYRMTGSVHDAEDLVQGSYLRVWRAIRGIEDGPPLRTWEFRMPTSAPGAPSTASRTAPRCAPGCSGSPPTPASPTWRAASAGRCPLAWASPRPTPATSRCPRRGCPGWSRCPMTCCGPRASPTRRRRR